MKSFCILKISYMILNLCSDRAHGSFDVSGIVKKYEGAFGFYSNVSDNDKLLYSKFTLNQQSDRISIKGITGLSYSEIKKNNAIFDKLATVFSSYLSAQLEDQITRYFVKYKPNHKLSTELVTKYSESLGNAASKEINSSSFGKKVLVLDETEVDRRHKDLIPVNGTRLPTQSNNFLDGLKAVKKNEEISRKKVTVHLNGIKRFSENANSSRKSKSDPHSSVSVSVRQKRDAKYVLDEIEVHNLGDVYKYLHKLLNTFKTSVNFTMLASEPNMPSDAEILCIHTLDAYYAQTKGKCA